MAKIALDHDSTLAATAVTALDLIHGPGHPYSYDDVLSWNWGLDKFGTARYLSALWHAWTLRPLDVPLMDDTVVYSANRLYDEHEVHIVTAHPDHMGIAEGKMEWLDYHGIQYDEFHVVPTDTTKAVLDYDIYIDDKPHLPAEVNKVSLDKQVYVYDQAYNRDAEGDYKRVFTLGEAAEDILSVAHRI
jgi:5'(3')-deoxyribonucleotidase